MTFSTWADVLTGIWTNLEFRGRDVKSYKLYDVGDLPESISNYPSCFSYIENLDPMYSLAGPARFIWRGQTHFYLVEDVNKQHYPAIYVFMESIPLMTAKYLTLGGIVPAFGIDTETTVGVEGPLTLSYGGSPQEAPSLGVIAHWWVKDNLDGVIAPAA